MALRQLAGIAGTITAVLAGPLAIAGPTMASASTSTAYSDTLSGVSCPRPAMCMAVGDRARAIGTDQPLAERWDGNRWRVVATQAVAGKNGASYLETLSCATPTRCLAIGGAVTIHTNVLAHSLSSGMADAGAV